MNLNFSKLGSLFSFLRRKIIWPGVIIGVLLVSSTAYAFYLSNRILPHTSVGSITLSGLSREEASISLRQAVDDLSHKDIRMNVDGTPELIQTEAIGLNLDLAQTVDAAFARGHRGSVLNQFFERLSSVWQSDSIAAPVSYDDQSLREQINGVADATEIGKKDIRLSVQGTTVSLLTDTSPGHTLPRDQVQALIADQLGRLDTGVLGVSLADDPPRADPQKAVSAVRQAEAIIARPLLLTYEDVQFYISREMIGSWIISSYNSDQLVAALDPIKIGQYVANIASTLNVSPVPAKVTTDETGHVTGFVPPKVGLAVDESALAQMVNDALMSRASASKTSDNLIVPMKSTRVSMSGLNSAIGITELIGKAVTTFAGSPKNRISNIKNGVKFLTGAIIQPGDEFSTLKTLGAVDNTTGYLPELVIKGDRTTPDFGGGLCQVSTTLFRAVMNAGLPITARRNHSYRVSYYEKDGNGNYIGPGLDATIYEPDLDLRFRNDMTTPVLIIGYVVDDKVTFELYGTKDGRKSNIIGPKLLSEIPPGDPVYLPTDALPQGMKKQVETPHPGGSAEAIYNITYADGHTASQDFKSYYRRWPAQYLVGTNTNCSTAAQCAALVASPTPTPSAL